MKVLLLNQTFHPDVASTAQHASDLATESVRRGHDVTVVCSQRAYDNPTERYPHRERWRGIEIRRISSSGFGKKARWRRAADFGSYLANCLVHLSVLPAFDVVIGMTSPPLISSLGALFTHVKGGRFVFWVMDLNPDEALAAGWLRPHSWTTRGLQTTLHYGLQRATSVVALDRFMAGLIEAKGVAASKIVVLAPWSHDQVVQYDIAGRARFRQKHGLSDKFVVMYSGNHSPCHPLTTLLESARRLKDHRNIAFCFVGGGSEFKTVQKFAARHALENVVTLPYQPLDQLSASLSSADLHTVVMGNAFVGIVHPCKVYNIRTLGIPYLYIGPAESHIADMRPPFSAHHDDVEGAVQHVLAAAESRTARIERTNESDAHGHDHVVGQLVAALESAGAQPSAMRAKFSTSPAAIDR